MAVDVELLYATLAGTRFPEESRRKNDEFVMLAAIMDSLKATLTTVPRPAPVDPFTGATDWIVGGVFVFVGANTRSTQ